MSPPLPKWRPRQTVIDLYTEKEHTPWYWRLAATVSACLILLGFLIFPSSFKPNLTLTVSNRASITTALIFLVFGYIVSAATAIVSSSWLFQLDILLIPCLTSCVLGLFNVLYNLSIHDKTPQWTAPAIAAVVISASSTFAYTIAALLISRKIWMIRARDAMHRPNSEDTSTDKLMLETDQQRQQLLRLLLQQQEDRTATPDINHSTFNIEWNMDRRISRSTIGTLRNLPRAARNAYENRTNSIYGRQDTTDSHNAPPMEPVTEEAPSDPPLESLPATAYVPPSRNINYDDAGIPGVVNTQSYISQSSPMQLPSNLPTLQESGYPLEKPPINESHLLERPQDKRPQPQYYMVAEDQPAIEQRIAQQQQQGRLRSISKASNQTRETRRMEIELSERGKGEEGLGREDLNSINFVPSIRRVDSGV